MVDESPKPDLQAEVYVRRDAHGRVQSVSLIADAQHAESLAPTAPELNEFAKVLGSQGDALAESDLPLTRVLEDLIDLLIKNDLLRFTDLPDAAQAKLLERRSLRDSLRGLQLIGDDDSVI